MRKYRWKRSRRWMENTIKDSEELIKEYETTGHVFDIDTCNFCKRYLMKHDCGRCPWVVFEGIVCFNSHWAEGFSRFQRLQKIRRGTATAKAAIIRLKAWVALIKNEMRKQDA